MEKNTFVLHETEAFMRGDLDNVTISEGRIVLDLVSGGHVPYGCYTSPAVPMPVFDALRISWNAGTPPGTAVEAQARVMVDGNWTSWFGFGRWSPYLSREGAQPGAKGAVVLGTDSLTLDSKTATQVQLRIYLYTKDEKVSPCVTLLCASVRARDVIPAGGRPVHARLHLMPYVVERRAPALRSVMDLAICLASLTNRWGADLLPEEFALAMRDYRTDSSNLSFAAAAAGTWGFPCWVCWGSLSMLRAEVRAGYGVIVGLESTPAQQAAVERTRDMMVHAGIDTQICADIQAEIWRKYMLNCAYNVLTAAYNRTIGQLRDDPVTRQEYRDLLLETLAVAQAKGVALTREIALAEYDRFLHKLEDDATSSLQRDLHPADGAPPRESERDTFSGYLVREAHRLGISVPLSERYDQMLRNM